MREEIPAPIVGDSISTTPTELKNKPKKRLLIILVGAMVLLLGGGVGAWKMHLPPFASKGEASHKERAGGQDIVLPIPATTANLDNGNGRTVYVKLKASLVIDGGTSQEALQTNMPEIEDILQTYLHETRPEDLHGGGFYRLREALLRRLKIVLAPLKVRDIFITELLTQ